MRQLVVSKNNLFFFFLVFGYLFGVIFYDFLGFDFTDELMAFFLVLFTGVTVWERKCVKQLYPLLWLILIFTFYIIYSIIIKSNIPKAILMDAVIQIKPFLGFYCAYIVNPKLSLEQKKILVIITLLISIFIFIIGATHNTWLFFGHPSRLATAATATAFLFLYCSSFSKTDIFIFILILSVGFVSTRSKFYGFWGVAVFLALSCKMGLVFKFNFRNILFFSLMFVVAVILSWDKIATYYIVGVVNSGNMWSRPAMMITAFYLLFDYFPFGTGLASFGTYTSGIFYSSIYPLYNLAKLFGLTKDNPAFVCDAYYPELAQFGVVGVCLYYLFWYKILKKSYEFQSNKRQFLLVLLIFIFFLIEGIADATFTHNRGLFILIILGCVSSNNNRSYDRKIK